VPIIFFVVLGFIVFGVVALMLMPNFFRPSAEAQRVFDVTKSDRVDVRTVRGKEQLQGRLLQILALSVGARAILEIGTLGGYEARKSLVAATGGKDLPIALIEDGIAIALALWVVAYVT